MPAALLSDVPVREALAAGLKRVDALVPGQGFAELTAGARGDFAGGLVGFARGELGYKPLTNLSLFAFGEATVGGMTPGWMAGVGGRVTW